jgi:hypothetical protein
VLLNQVMHCAMFCNVRFDSEELLAPRPTSMLEEHPSLAVATIHYICSHPHICRPFLCTQYQILFEGSNQEDEMGGACGTYGRQERCVHGFGGATWGAERPLVRPRCRWEDNIKMDRQEVEWRGMDWIDLAQDRDRWQALVNAVMNLRVL